MIDAWAFIAGVLAFAIFGFMVGVVFERDRGRDPRRRK